MPRLRSAAPVLPVLDLAAAIAHYRALGFAVEAYAGAEQYAFAERDGVALHLSRWADHDPARTGAHVYLYVDDADALHAAWSTSGTAGRHVSPVDTDYGLREGAHVDPDGNLLRYGSPLRRR
ncbi:VOC family protein [Patulibacter brassicae]|uniref:Bleomycin resistance protein n=1 Tax=Patulibacter brassicae TaxID=1705717 RepID=A0ABU4VHE4_9ACTN|nr:VOC family protein [Patulibacter brassicae]MDX8150797.1 VOC family protein [Patulibacter brassicae]